MHASWVSTVGTNGQVLVDAAHERGGPRRRAPGGRARGRAAPSAQVAFSNSLWTDSQLMPFHAAEGDDEREQDAEQHPDVDQAESLDLERRDVFGAGGGRELAAERLQRLALVLDPLGEAGGERRRLHHRDDRRRPVPCPSAATTAATARSSPTSCAVSTRSAASSRSDPVLLAAGVGRAEVVERDLAVVGHQHAEAVEVAVRDPRRGAARSSCCHAAREHRVGDALGRERADRRAAPAAW